MARQKKDTRFFGQNQLGMLADGDNLRRMVEELLQALIEGQFEGFIGAEKFERTKERKGYRNGYRARSYTTRVGKIELLIPRDREGEFSPELFERYQRSEKAFLAALVEMYLNGVSTRKVKEVVETLCGVSISKSTVSRAVEKLDQEIATWRERRLEKKYPLLIVDARYEKVRKNHRIVSQGVMVVVGIDRDGNREILGVWIGDSENEYNWTSIFMELKDRGLTGLEYIVSDAHKGLVSAIQRCFQGTVWQRCRVHFMRNMMSQVGRKDWGWVSDELRAMFDSPTREQAMKCLVELVEMLEKRHPAAADNLERAESEVLSYYALPDRDLRKRLNNTNVLERLNQEFKRRTRVIRVFPSATSCLRLISALAIEKNDEWLSRKYVILSEKGDRVLLSSEVNQLRVSRHSEDNYSGDAKRLSTLPGKYTQFGT